MSASLMCETKENTTLTTLPNNGDAVVFTDLLGLANHGYSLTWFKSIFSYLGPTKKESMKLRRYCKLFSKALKPLPCWTSFPHPKYSSLKGLFDRFNELAGSGSMHIPKLVLIDDGIHVIERYQDEYGEVDVVKINIPIFIIGESREHCILIGGLQMNGWEGSDVHVSDLTLRQSKGIGVEGRMYGGASIHLDNVSIENSGQCGVAVYGKRNTMKNCNVSHSKSNGLVVSGDDGLMTIDGDATTIHHNCISGCSCEISSCYVHVRFGMHVYTNSSIHLLSPLTKDMITKNNGGGGNYGGAGTIKTITSNELDCNENRSKIKTQEGMNQELENCNHH